MVKLGELLEVADEYNSNGLKLQFFGVNKDKQFMPTIANTEGLNPTKYKIIRKNIFVFNETSSQLILEVIGPTITST